ncbi:unnamed protein product [Brugia pahangi]|uniref:Calponin-homology (CH) domain-containing protein n=1 Tax=Brugia pahangi TaxID=6280 RepID=A0A0N4THN7_BRUPA|nr:unnamed protein product [Brugia pahangi]
MKLMKVINEKICIKVLESRLNTTLPSGRSQLSASLADGVKLCNFANRIRLRAVHSLFTPVSDDVNNF